MDNKKIYKRPQVQVEQFTPETSLCSCVVINKQVSEAIQCGYELEGLGFNVFAQNWVDCDFSEEAVGKTYAYCYMPGANNLFSS